MRYLEYAPTVGMTNKELYDIASRIKPEEWEENEIHLVTAKPDDNYLHLRMHHRSSQVDVEFFCSSEDNFPIENNFPIIISTIDASRASRAGIGIARSKLEKTLKFDLKGATKKILVA